jgi:Secretion system C-terminal sorting domain
MKKIYLIALCAFFNTQIWAQAPNALSFTFDKSEAAYATNKSDSFFVAHHVDSLFALAFTVKNIAGAKLEFTWERTQTGAPTAWEFVTCDPVNCFAPKVATSKFTLDPDQNGSMIIDAFTNGVVGTSILKMKFSAKGYNMQTIKVVFKASKSSVGTNDLNLNKIAIAPNPVQDNFRLIGFEQKINQLQVIDVTGRIVRNFEAFENADYNVSDLEKGAYFVNLLDNKGNKLGTKKFLKVN